MVFSNILIFYYEGIERVVESGIVAIISELLGPLMFIFILYPFMGINSVWISFPLGFTLSIVVVSIYVKIVEGKEKQYSGLFFIKKELLEKSRNYTIKSKNDDVKTDMFNHLKSLDIDPTFCETLNQIINRFFELNDDGLSIEILLIDYDDRIVVNMKDEGKREVMRDIETSFSQDNVKVSEVMDFNNIEYVFCKN